MNKRATTCGSKTGRVAPGMSRGSRVHRAAGTLYRAALAASVVAAGCAKPAPQCDVNIEYVAPKPAQLTPPPSVTREPGNPAVTFQAQAEVVEVPVAGNAFRPIRAATGSATDGRRRLELVINNDGDAVTFADEDWHIFPTGSAGPDGSMMLCWNTLTGESSEYSPDAPDPARGMALNCRLFKDGQLQPTERIRVPTVGCWIRRVVALGNESYRLLYKGDDGWFEAGSKPNHGVYEVYYSQGRWTEPALLIPVPTLGTL